MGILRVRVSTAGEFIFPLDRRPMRLRSLFFELVTDATALDRIPQVQWIGPDGILGYLTPVTAQGASLTYNWTFGLGFHAEWVNTTSTRRAVHIPLPDIITPNTATLKLIIENWQTADVLNGGLAIVEYD